jgi:hypothetical protein
MRVRACEKGEIPMTVIQPIMIVDGIFRMIPRGKHRSRSDAKGNRLQHHTPWTYGPRRRYFPKTIALVLRLARATGLGSRLISTVSPLLSTGQNWTRATLTTRSSSPHSTRRVCFSRWLTCQPSRKTPTSRARLIKSMFRRCVFVVVKCDQDVISFCSSS